MLCQVARLLRLCDHKKLNQELKTKFQFLISPSLLILKNQRSWREIKKRLN